MRNIRFISSLRLSSLLVAVVATIALTLAGCSATRHVPQGDMLLDRVDIKVQGDSSLVVSELYNFLRQQPNQKVLGFAKLQLATYNMSGSDTTKWYNRWLRKLGQPPVLYDDNLTTMSSRQLHQALINRGYLDANVSVDTTIYDRNRRIKVRYNLNTGRPHIIKSIDYDVPDTTVRSIVLADTAAYGVHTGMHLDRNALDNLRTALTSQMRNHGYYAFNKDDVSFLADTIRGSKDVDLTVVVRNQVVTNLTGHSDTITALTPYFVRNVTFVTDYDPVRDGTDGSFAFTPRDTVHYHDITILYGPDRYLKPAALEDVCYIRAGHRYNASAVDRTYEALSRYGIVKFINISLRPVGIIDGKMWLDAYVLLTRNKKQGVTIELEGTNSEGDLGFGVGITYQHRNLAHASELLTTKLRTSYESLSGNIEGLINNRYTEYAGEVGITFPKFKAPFLSTNFKRRIQASTEFALSANYQERPEYTRIIAGAAWKYKWSAPVRRAGFNERRTLDLLDINYVRLPHSTLHFLDSIAPTNPLLRYSYEDHFIMRLGYSLYRSNKRIPTSSQNAFSIQPSVTTMRFSAEVAGNLLYAISKISGARRHDGAYKVLGIPYSQYARAEFDFTHVINLNSRNALGFHAGFGIGIPYGNSRMIPFEKRFYAGGANNVRGWAVRTLGPGSYDARSSVADFINQCGDISLDLNIEYRAKLFWVFEGALFIDGGNIWTIYNYESQPGGVFKFNKFYKQLAAAYGAGIRMDFTYFLLRLDLGMKAHNPAMNQEPWPIIHPNWHRDATFHFSVGYPF